MKKILTIILLISIPLSCGAKSIFKAGSDFYDENHNIINAHGAGFLKIKDTYYWYGELRTTHQDNTGKVNVYSSNDLYKWKYRGVALDLSGKKDKYSIERPKVIYNDNTKKYVMWFHVELHGHYQTAIAGVAQSDSPAGPFEFINITWPNKKSLPVFSDIHNIKESWYIKNVERGEQVFKRDFNRGQAFRDMTLFKDDNGKAYLIYASEDNLSLHISELDKTYTQLDGNFSRVLVGLKNEAPTIFKHNGLYYLIT